MKNIRIYLSIVILAISLPLSAQSSKANDLTVLNSLQTLGKELLKNQQGSIIAVRPTTGEIICMVSNTLHGDNINRAFMGSYPPGSTIKTAQALVFYTEGIVNDDIAVDCDKGFYVGTTHIGCHKHYSPLRLTESIAHSCNSYFCVNFMDMIDDVDKYGSSYNAMNKWKEYMTSFGLGAPLGVDFRGEASGFIPGGDWMNKKYPNGWDSSRTMYMGFGQGQMMCTPLQLCNLAAIIANRGWYRIPHLHKNSLTQYPGKYITQHWAKATRDAINRVVTGMRGAVRYGTARGINTSQYAICGKTGTIQNPGKDHSAFIAFAPMDNPQIAICVLIENGGDGSDCAAPIASKIIQRYLAR